MSYQAYLDTIKAKTGKTPEDFQKLAAQKGLSKYPELMAWLKTDFGLGHGHANVIAQLVANAGKPPATADEALGRHFRAGKAVWRASYDKLSAAITRFGPDISFGPNSSYINVLRNGKKFAILQPSSAARFDVGIKLKGIPSHGRLAAAGSWNAMVTHRVSLDDPAQVDAQLIGWLKQAYDAA